LNCTCSVLEPTSTDQHKACLSASTFEGIDHLSRNKGKPKVWIGILFPSKYP